MDDTKRFSRYVKQLALLVLVSIIGFGSFNAIVDPLQFYRASWLTPTFTFNQRYQNPGLAKNYPYDSVIIGTSYAENFTPTLVNEKLGWHSLKLAIEGGTLREQYLILKFALEKGKVNNVLWGIEVSRMGMDPLEINEGFPLYMYDDALWNDYPYWFSSDVFLRGARTLLVNAGLMDYPWTMDNINTWHHQFTYSEANMWSQWRPVSCQKRTRDDAVQAYVEGFQINILSLIEAHPDVNFYLFYPPFSILRSIRYEQNGFMDLMLEAKRAIFSQLSELPNVKLFDFLVAEEVTTDLNHYRDFGHYSRDVNAWMLDQITQDNFLVGKENLVEFETQLKNQIETYINHHRDQICKPE